MIKHPDCEDRCQILEHKGYHTCSQTGRCEQFEAERKMLPGTLAERHALYLEGCASWAASVTKSGDNNPDAKALREAAALLRQLQTERNEAEAALLDVVEYGRTPGILEKHSAAITRARARKGER